MQIMHAHCWKSFFFSNDTYLKKVKRKRKIYEFSWVVCLRRKVCGWLFESRRARSLLRRSNIWSQNNIFHRLPNVNVILHREPYSNIRESFIFFTTIFAQIFHLFSICTIQYTKSHDFSSMPMTEYSSKLILHFSGEIQLVFFSSFYEIEALFF